MGTMILKFEVPGIPVAQGSKRVFGKRVVESNANALRPWRQAITAEAAERYQEHLTMTGPVEVQIQFFFPRPKGHYGTGRNEGRLRKSAPVDMITKPDLDKLVRSVLDALTYAAVFRDDSQVVSLLASKHYAPAHRGRPGVQVIVMGEAVPHEGAT